MLTFIAITLNVVQFSKGPKLDHLPATDKPGRALVEQPGGSHSLHQLEINPGNLAQFPVSTAATGHISSEPIRASVELPSGSAVDVELATTPVVPVKKAGAE